MNIDPYEFARTSRGRCFVRSVKIGDQWVAKAMCDRCPKCGAGLPGMLANDGFEYCLKSSCDYHRQVFTTSELGANK